MYKRDEYYYSKIDTGYLYKELDTHYSAETDLVSNLMSYAITDDLVETRHELAVANEELWCLNDWPEGEGFSSSGALGEARGAFRGRSGGGMVRDSLVEGLSARYLGCPRGPPRVQEIYCGFRAQESWVTLGGPSMLFLLKAKKHTKCNRSIIFGKNIDSQRCI